MKQRSWSAPAPRRRWRSRSKPTSRCRGEEEPAAPILAGLSAHGFADERAAPVMPADEVACRRELKSLGVAYQELPPINDGRLVPHRLSDQGERASRAASG